MVWNYLSNIKTKSCLSAGFINKILNRFLWKSAKKYDLRIADFNGGNLRNAIAREAFALIVVSENYKENILADFKKY